MIVTVAFLAAGLVALFFGGEALVRGSVALASRLGIPPLIIGLTIVGFGTSTPELIVSVSAALKGASDIAVGNIVGSNIANILLILGAAALITPIAVKFPALSRDLAVMILTSLVLLILAHLGTIERWAAGLMLASLILYIVYLMKYAPEQDECCIPAPRAMSWLSIVLLIAGGFCGLMLGANWLVDSSITIARAFDVPEAVIGLTIVAVGTSLPELATSIVAAYRRECDVAIGNVVGSNIFNILGILGVTALVTPMPISDTMAYFDIPAMMAISIGFAALVFLLKTIGRIVAMSLLMSYTAYIFFLF